MVAAPSRALTARRVAEGLFGLALIVLAVAAREVAAGFPVRARSFPMALIWCVGAVGAGLVATALVRWNGADAHAGWRRSVERLVAPTLILAAGFAVLRTFGFYVAAPLLLAAFHVAHALAAGERATPRLALRAAALAAVGTAATWALFAALLGLPAPSGALL